jgi:preprotein translocase subunit YajC
LATEPNTVGGRLLAEVSWHRRTAHGLPPRGQARTPIERTFQVDPSIVLLLGLLVLVYLNVAGRRRSQRNRASLEQRLVPGAEVVTTSGLHGSVDEVDDDGTVLLEIAPGWVTRWDKAAVGRIVDSPADAVAEEADETAESAPTPESAPNPEPADELSTDPTAEPGTRPLPDTAPPDRG